ncbi:MAG: AbrB/MazE/SpoVT family DNA-binding domain-containing protein [Alphaproteobacteria bacterium]|nr:AbrB/MazE/SpoVT family DNA-binding domain-containing protein [Alphaproteobacteria bacterium]
MQHTLKITRIGNSLGVILPKEMLAKLRVGKGDQLFFTEIPHGFQIQEHNPEFEQQMELAETVMRKHRDVLALLAK